MQVDTQILAVLLRFAIGIVALMVGWQFVLKPTLVDGFRQRLFALRHDLFLFMAGGHVSSRDPVYVNFRETLNFLIRYAERLTGTRAILAFFVPTPSLVKNNGDLSNRIASIPDEKVRKRIMQYRREMSRAIFCHLLCIAPLAIPALVLLSVIQTIFLRDDNGRMNVSRVDITRTVEVEAELSARGAFELCHAG